MSTSMTITPIPGAGVDHWPSRTPRLRQGDKMGGGLPLSSSFPTRGSKRHARRESSKLRSGPSTRSSLLFMRPPRPLQVRKDLVNELVNLLPDLGKSP
jgi:hypothetical protein